MKKLILITGIILIACVLISYLSSPAVPPSAPLPAATAPPEQSYILKSEDGLLVVYREGESEPFLVTETYAGTLPRSDRAALEKGITLAGRKELREALEDYCS